MLAMQHGYSNTPVPPARAGGGPNVEHKLLGVPLRLPGQEGVGNVFTLLASSP